jgi:hypothetical protein
MKKSISLGLAVIALMSVSSFTVLSDCTSFDQFKEGTTWTTTTYDAKGKESSHVDCKTTKVTTTAEASVADITGNFFDDKGKENGSATYTVTCKGGEYSMDLRNFVTPELKSQARDMDIKIEGDNMQYPSTIKVGDALPGGTMTITMSKDGQVMSTTTVVIKDRKCEALESKTTSAGTWECYKITSTQDISIKTAMMTIPVKPRQSAEWFNFKVGPVRTESLKDGKIESYSELTAFKKP